MEPIVESVRTEGDKAVKELTAKFDRVEVDDVVVELKVCIVPCVKEHVVPTVYDKRTSI